MFSSGSARLIASYSSSLILTATAGVSEARPSVSPLLDHGLVLTIPTLDLSHLSSWGFRRTDRVFQTPSASDTMISPDLPFTPRYTPSLQDAESFPSALLALLAFQCKPSPNSMPQPLDDLPFNLS